MGPSNSSDLDNAICALLGSDAELLALCPNGVSMDIGDDHATRFVVVSIVETADVETLAGGLATELVKYAIKAVMAKSAHGDINAAAARIEALLHNQPLTVAGYAWGAMYRDEDDPRIRYTERDDTDTSIVWFHRGINVRVVMARDPGTTGRRSTTGNGG